MAQLLLLLAVGLGLTVAQYPQIHTAYTPGHEFIYRYESQVVNGIPDNSAVYSIYKVICNARVQCNTATKCLLALEDAQIFKKNARVVEVDPMRAQIPPSLLEPVTGAEAAAVIEQLIKPIVFKYDRGLVQDILTEPDEPYWSINFKRGVINLFQVNLDGRKALPVSAAPINLPAVYKVIESCPVGECETLYAVQAASAVTGRANIVVKKTRDYKNCVETPFFILDSMNAEKCIGCAAKTEEALVPSAHIAMWLQGTENSFIVDTVVAESRFTAIPNGRMSPPIVACTNQTIRLVASSPVQVPIAEPRGLISQEEGLKLYIPERAAVEAQLTVPGPHQYAPARWQPITEAGIAAGARATLDQVKVEMADKLIATLATLISKPVANLKDAPTYIRLLTEVLRNCSSAEMKAIVQKWGIIIAGEAASEITVKKLVLNIAAIAGTYPAVEVICDAVIAGEIPAPLAEAIAIKLGHHAIATPIVAKKIMEVAKCSAIQPVQHAKQGAWLAAGMVMHRLAGTERFLEKERIQVKTKIAAIAGRDRFDAGLERLQGRVERRVTKAKQLCQAVRTEFVENIKAILEGAGWSPDKLMAIKAIGNAGLPELLPVVAAQAIDTSLPKVIRAQIISEMRRMAKIVPGKVLKAALPIYLDIEADEQVRVAAFTVIVACKPSFAVWQLLANSLKTEVNNQVGSFVYSFLAQMSVSTYPCACECAANATVALYQAKAFIKGLGYSQFIHIPKYWENANTGIAIDKFYVGSRASSIMPQAGSVRIRSTVAGFDVAPVEIGWNAQGLEDIIAQIADQWSGVAEKMMNRPPKRGSNPGEDVINSILGSLRFASETGADPQANVYIKFYGNTAQFYTIDKPTLKALFENAHTAITTGKTINVKEAFNIAETLVLAPTEAGMICRLHVTTPVIAGLEGRVTINTIPELAQAIRQRRVPEKIDIIAEIKPVLVKELFAHIAVDALTRQAGVASRTVAVVGDITVKATGTCKPKTGKISIKIDTPTEAKEVIKLEIVPVTFIRKLPLVAACTPGVVPIAEETEIAPIDARIKPFNRKFGGKILGVEIAAVGQIAHACAMCTSSICMTAFTPFVGKDCMSIRVAPGIDPGTSIEIQAAIGKSKLEKVVSATEASWSSKFNPINAIWAGAGAEKSQVTELGMTNLETSPLYTADVARRLQVAEVAEQVSCAIAVRVNGGAVKRLIQGEVLIQRDPTNKQKKVAMIIKRTPIPEVETHPWQAEVRNVVEDDRKAVDIQMLLSAGYQQSVAEQIKRLGCKTCAVAIEGIIAQKAVIFQKLIKASVVAPIVAHPRISQICAKQVAIAKQILQVKKAAEHVPAESLISQVETAVAAWKNIMNEIHEIIGTECGKNPVAVRGPICADCAAQVQLAQVVVQHAAILPQVEPLIRYVQQAAAAGKQTMFSWSDPAEQALELRQQYEIQTFATTQAIDAMLKSVKMHKSCEKISAIQASPMGITCRTTIAWGPQNQPKENQILVDAIVKKSSTQLILESQQVNPIARHPAIAKVVQGSVGSDPVALKRVKRIEQHANELGSFSCKIDATRAKIPIPVQTTLVAIQEAIKHRWYSISTVSKALADLAPAGTAIIKGNLRISGRKADIVLATPSETVKCIGIPLTRWCTRTAVDPRVAGPTSVHIAGPIAKPEDTCVVKGTRVVTFDGRKIELNIPAVVECHKVLAMDCSPKKAFAVIIKQAPGEKAVIVATRYDKVELVAPIAAPEEARVIINGQVTAIDVGASITTQDTPVPGVPVVALTITNHGGKLIEVKAIHAGITVWAKPEVVSVKAWPSLRTKLCGLCGNYDGEESNDFMTPQMKVVKHVHAFHTSYLVPSAQCDAVKIRDIQWAAKTAAVCVPAMKNVIIEEGNRICISKEAVPVCPAGCIAKGEKVISASCHCLDARTSAAKILRQEAQTRILRELVNKTTDTHKPVPIPVKCKPVM